MKTFHVVVLGIFGALAVAGILLFAGLGGLINPSAKIGTGVIWGTLPSTLMEPVLQEVRIARNDFNNVTYIEKDSRTYDADMINAIAAGRGPDLFLLSQD